MRKNIQTALLLSAALAFTAGTSFADAVMYANSVCISSNCTAGTLSAGQSDSGSFNATVMINGDTFSVMGNYLDTLSPDGTVPIENLNVRVTLTATAGGGGSANDDIEITDLLDKFAWPYSSDTFFEQGTFSFGGGLATHSSVEERLIVDNTPLPYMGPYYPFTTQTGSNSMVVSTPDDPLPMDFQDVFDFSYGSMPGAYIQVGVASTPEPAYAVPVFLIVFGLALMRYRSRLRAV